MSRIIIAITGASGSGKTTLGHALAKSFGTQAVCLSTDQYYKNRSAVESVEEYRKKNFDHPDALLLDKFTEDVINLFKGRSVTIPEFDFSGETLSTTKGLVVESRSIIILEGIFCLHPLKVRELVSAHGFSIMTHAPSAIVLQRVLKRDKSERQKSVNFILSSYTDHVLNGYYNFIKPLKTQCDLCLPTWSLDKGDISVEELTQTALKTLVSHLSADHIKLLNQFDCLDNRLNDLVR